VYFTGLERFDTILTGLLVILPLVMLMSAFTYHLIEKPFLSMRRGYLSPSTPQKATELHKNNSNN
jgi:peptidoglycan/LPS O-acetylase OafA/YrhL